ncbi:MULTISPECIES: RrF2 family transcriptional regulator [Romboutsia]|uniref:Transcriptional regulator, Rrf2 n=1 Tax=Romboutsia hominis TaxID=1507512 RepID=A0A2P2BTF9_9FIRM|nr:MULTISPECIES: Rrf2 family transcriptional regulator [Romboutsia]MCH1960897.1 Rrf2 family transcriptional regulator [Romboutsia hominis]MCH1968669.1 Rrf2 family transcriptional regulator [Romboutsia hominis]MDB8789676.1 Rrf2 family transcriptional regulator [Romboutsia sp. 1001216sp1]MDB8792984.1 Rrf2 family transcriptional regulator [Romboutsia sp. 1001216sp1]MDB8795213.1 Rrf2 family transcriptional regulator [Romboutsia sp. 1001216sp1]
MKLSTKGRYGLKAMFELSLNEENGPVPLKYIAKKQNISEQYLEQIFSSLKKSGLVKSVRGAQGGYLLAKKPEEIKVGDILVVLEGPISISDCVIDEDICENSNICVTKVVWEKLKKGIEDVINAINLQDMIDDYNKNKLDCDITNLLK